MEPPPLPPIICSYPFLLDALAQSFLAGPWNVDGLVDRANCRLDRRYRWLRPLATRVLAAFADRPRPRQKRLVEFLRNDTRLLAAFLKHHPRLHLDRGPAPEMTPTPGPPQFWPLPPLATLTDLAHFLQLQPNELDWFADTQSRERKAPIEPLRHYRYRWVSKSSGAHRLIEAPKPRLKHLQRQLLDELLIHIPPHPAAHGFRAGRSIKSFVEPHVGRAIVLKMDLRDFFVSITAARVISIYLTAGYPEPVARYLAGLSTNAVPRSVLASAGPSTAESVTAIAAHWRNSRAYRVPHLPQGAPTSPALANLIAYRLDARLTGLAKAAGATFTRYADDLLFSGEAPFTRSIHRFPAQVGAIAIEEGFTIQHHKTRIMRQGVRQRAAGIVINQRINLCRQDFDTLKATLTNAIRHGPHTQNRAAIPDFRAHLAGRIAHATQLNPDRGRKLTILLDQIQWSES